VAVLLQPVAAAGGAGPWPYLAHRLFRRRRDEGRLLRPGLGLAALVLLQIALGGGTWINKYGWPDWFAQYEFAQRFVVVPGSAAQMWITTGHVAVGSLVLVTALVISLRLWRLTDSADKASSAAIGQRSLSREV